MKVEGPRGPSKTAAPKKTARARGAGFAEALKGPDAASGDGEVEAAHGAAPATSLDALLAIQGVEATPDATDDRPGKNKKAEAWGGELLDGLEDIRRDLLRGEVPPERLTALANTIAEKRGDTDDPRLREILSEIELRAKVEIAKRRRGQI